jgi:hypothetical protein
VTGGSRTGGGPVSNMGRERESTGMRKWPVIGVLLLGGGVAVYSGTTGSLPFMAKSAAPRPPAVRVPVSAAEVQRMDVPVYLNGIGTVQAFNSVVVKSRVDGQIVKINFSEGKDVHAGDVLVEIDPRPFEASLERPRPTSSRTRRSSPMPVSISPVQDSSPRPAMAASSSSTPPRPWSRSWKRP